MQTLYQFFESKQTDALKVDIEIKQFNVEYYAVDKNTVSDVITAKETVSNTGSYKLRSFVHDLSKTIAQKQNGEVTITFAMEDLLRKKEYLISIKFSHNRDKGIGVFQFKANERESSTNVNGIKINDAIITPNERILFNKIKSEAPESYPQETFFKLIYLIYYSLKGVLKTQNYSNKSNTIK